MPSDIFRIAYLHYSQIKHSDWLKEVTWLNNQSGSFISAQHNCATLKIRLRHWLLDWDSCVSMLSINELSRSILLALFTWDTVSYGFDNRLLWKIENFFWISTLVCSLTSSERVFPATIAQCNNQCDQILE